MSSLKHHSSEFLPWKKNVILHCLVSGCTVWHGLKPPLVMPLQELMALGTPTQHLTGSPILCLPGNTVISLIQSERQQIITEILGSLPHTWRPGPSPNPCCPTLIVTGVWGMNQQVESLSSSILPDINRWHTVQILLAHLFPSFYLQTFCILIFYVCLISFIYLDLFLVTLSLP